MDLFEIGEIVKTRGLHGCLKVLSSMEATKIFPKIDSVYIEEKSGFKNRFGLKKINKSGRSLFIELNEITDVESAKDFVGCKVFLPRDILEELPEGEYYCQDVIGIDVFNEEGIFIGKIVSIFPTGSNDVYVCRGGKKEVLLPAISDVIRNIDIRNKTMTVKIPEGL